MAATSRRGTAAFLLCAASCSVAIAAGAPFDVAIVLTDASLVLVPVDINRTGPHLFLLDTAATTTMVDETLTGELGLRTRDIVQMQSAGGVFDTASATLEELRIGSSTRRWLPVSSTSLVELRRQDNRIRGVLGQDVLSDITLTIDFRARRIRIATGACDEDGARIPFRRADGRPMIEADVAAAPLPRESRLVIDSAANALIVFADVVSASNAKFSTHGGTATGRMVRDVRVTIGGLTFRKDAFVVASTARREETGLLPASWFSRVCIGRRGEEIVLTR